MKSALYALFILLFIMGEGCAKRAHEIQLNLDSGINSTGTVAVAPFTGNPYRRAIASEWLTYILKKRISNTIISPAMAEHLLAKEGIQLYLREEGEEQAEKQADIIASQPVILRYEHYSSGDELKTYEFSEKDLLKIGKTLAVDYIISGCVIKNEFSIWDRWELVIVKVTDVVNRKNVAIIYQAYGTRFDENPLGGSGLFLQTMVTDDIEAISDDIVELFLKKKDSL